MIHSVIQALRLVPSVRPSTSVGWFGAACSLLGAVMFGYCVWQRLAGADDALYGSPLLLLSLDLLVVGIQIIVVVVALRIAKRVHRWIR